MPLDGVAFHAWIDDNGVTFPLELLEWARLFSDILGVRVSSSYFGSAVVFTLYDVISDCMYRQ